MCNSSHRLKRWDNSCYIWSIEYSQSASLLAHNRMLLRSLSGVACTTPDTSKSQPTAYCFTQLKQGTCLIRLKKQPSLLPEDELPRDTTSIHPHLAAQTSVGTPIPRRCNRRTCHVLTARSFSWSICRSDMPLRSHLPHPILHPVSPFGNSL